MSCYIFFGWTEELRIKSEKGNCCIDEEALLKHYALHMVFPQRGCEMHIYTKMWFGLGRQRFVVENAGSLICASALGWGPEAGCSAVAVSCHPFVVSLLVHAFPVLQSSLLLEKCLLILVNPSSIFWSFLFLFILQIWIPKYCLTLWNYAERVYPAWTLGQNHTFFRTVQRLF